MIDREYAAAVLGIAHFVGAGLVAGLLSAAHCAAMCGPLAATVCAGSRPRWPMLRYQSGRVLGYALLGSIAGQLGTTLRWFGTVELALPLIAAGLLAAMGVGLLRRQRSAGLVTLRRQRSSPVLQAWPTIIPREPLLLGALSALLPCGALAAALMVAALSGGAASGAAVMLGFAIASGASVVASSWLLNRMAAVRRRTVARLCMALLWSASALVLMRPLYRQLTHVGTGAASAEAPTCH